ncbi:ATP-binding cassette domain-containing protein [Methylobacterium sp. Leaf91]|uniref:ATP-binding cassette domain-containing protein n=1 Tax=Methylobacterium sp. Leaf91 TaxID=1736247 RepID=UPI0006FA64D7|nr:ATP-binding cassette domain-containing protein [Methylobacterium sp. Leaf91]KQO94297.1 iron-hydroxamate transporter ATP-binding subunit [Methylobacterium sp. Leaf91]
MSLSRADAGARREPSPDDADYSLDGVTFSVPGRVLLHPLSLVIPTGRVIGLIGHNGSGKSTLIKLLARQQAPSGGRLLFKGASIESLGDRAFAREVAYLPQATPQAPGMLVKELVAMGRYPWHGALGRLGSTDRDAIAEAMRLTKVTPFAERMVDSLSGGERQRVWLAMLVAQNARCLLLDEPIAALDIAHQIEVLSLVRHLSQERGLTVIVVLHDVNMAARTCDDLIALHRGRLIARGTPAEIVTPEGLEAIYGVRMGVFPHPRTGMALSYLD